MNIHVYTNKIIEEDQQTIICKRTKTPISGQGIIVSTEQVIFRMFVMTKNLELFPSI